ncbi:MAG: OmpA family protein [Proteobacteria bacterium]|nr:OmpA family protein [Pseudomonadota bacterium]
MNYRGLILIPALIIAISGCATSKNGKVISDGASSKDTEGGISSSLEDVEVSSSGSGLTPEEQRRIEEEELEAERQRLSEDQARADLAGFKLEDIFFAYDRADLTSEARETLDGLARWLEINSDINIRIEGHADERGSSEYNLALGARRAETAKRYLGGLDVGETRLSTISFGEEMPIKNGQGEAVWAENRRVHFEAR